MKDSMAPDKAWMMLWIVSSTAGLLLGAVIGQCVFVLLMRMGFAAFGAILHIIIIGVCIGLLQWLTVLRGIVNGLAWITACGLASILIAVVLSHPMTATIFKSNNTGCLGVAGVSVAVGLAGALPTGIVLSRYSSKVYLWVLGTILAPLAGILSFIPLALVLSGEDEMVGIIVGCCNFAIITPTIISAVLARFIYNTLKEAARR
jgi:hypothetical protein